MGFFQQKLPSYLMLWQLAIYLRLNQKNTPIAKMIVTMLIRAITCGFANKPKLDNFPIDSISLSLPKTFIKRSFSAFSASYCASISSSFCLVSSLYKLSLQAV